jgi:hypothetical protein
MLTSSTGVLLEDPECLPRSAGPFTQLLAVRVPKPDASMWITETILKPELNASAASFPGNLASDV